MFGRAKLAALTAEFMGSAILGTIVLTMVGRTDFPFFLAVASGLTVGLLHYVYGTHANPVVTVGLWTMRRLDSLTMIVMVAAQMLGGLAAWQLSQYLVNSQLANIANPNFEWQVLVAEALGSLVLGWGLAAAVGRTFDQARQAVVYGASLTVGVLVASLASNGLVNPAVAVAVQSWSLAYVAGPLLGGVAGMSLYGLLYADKPVATRKRKSPSARRLRKR